MVKSLNNCYLIVAHKTKILPCKKYKPSFQHFKGITHHTHPKSFIYFYFYFDNILRADSFPCIN